MDKSNDNGLDNVLSRLLEEHLACFLQQRGQETDQLSTDHMVDLVYNNPEVTPHFANYLLRQLVKAGNGENK